MASSLPTVRQLALLEQIDDDQVYGEIEDQGDGSVGMVYRLRPGAKDISPRVDALINRGWAQSFETTRRVTLTVDGVLAKQAAEYARRVNSLPYDHPLLRLVRVVARPRGRSSAGRNLKCFICYDLAKENFDAGLVRARPDALVWYTNESGAPAQREAERRREAHIVSHLNADDWRGRGF